MKLAIFLKISFVKNRLNKKYKLSKLKLKGRFSCEAHLATNNNIYSSFSKEV